MNLLGCEISEEHISSTESTYQSKNTKQGMRDDGIVVFESIAQKFTKQCHWKKETKKET